MRSSYYSQGRLLHKPICLEPQILGYDMQGRMVHQQEITDDVTSVDASGWKSGTYVWKLGIRNEELGIKEVEEGKWVKTN